MRMGMGKGKERKGLSMIYDVYHGFAVGLDWVWVFEGGWYGMV